MHDSNGIDDVQRVRDASDIVRVVGEHVELRQGPQSTWASARSTTTKPSMYVVPPTDLSLLQLRRGGDVFTFVQDYHKMTFREALSSSPNAGIKLESATADAPRLTTPTA